MSLGSWSAANVGIPHRNQHDMMEDHRARLAREEHERAQQRLLELEEQRSDLNSPRVRIRTWEKLHGLRLPANSAHPILSVVAAATRLTLAEVREEQLARLADSRQPRAEATGTDQVK